MWKLFYIMKEKKSFQVKSFLSTFGNQGLRMWIFNKFLHCDLNFFSLWKVFYLVKLSFKEILFGQKTWFKLLSISLGKKEQNKRIKYWCFLPKDVHVLQVWKVHIVGWSKRINWFCEKNIDIDKVSNGLQLIWITHFFIFYLLLTCFWSEYHSFKKKSKWIFPYLKKKNALTKALTRERERERGAF